MTNPPKEAVIERAAEILCVQVWKESPSHIASHNTTMIEAAKLEVSSVMNSEEYEAITQATKELQEEG